MKILLCLAILLGVLAYVYWPSGSVAVSVHLTVVKPPKPVQTKKAPEKRRPVHVRAVPAQSGSSCGGLTWNSGVGCEYTSRGWQVGPLTEFEGPLK